VPPTELVSLRDPEMMKPFLQEPLSAGWKSVYSLPPILSS
jgi:creatinine amidohydrolase